MNLKKDSILSGVIYILLGLLVGYFWIWGNAVQIQTSEAWILGKVAGNLFKPPIETLKQLKDFWTTPLSDRQVIAYSWGWITQIILLIFSIGIEVHQTNGKPHTNMFKQWAGKASIWLWGSLLFIILGSLADLNYGSDFGQTWQPWVFAGACLMASYFFGLVCIHFLIKGTRILWAIAKTRPAMPHP